MLSFQSMEALLEFGRETVVSLNLVHEQSVTSSLWRIQDVEERGTRGLFFIRNIRMPRDRRGAVCEEGVVCVVPSTSVDEMNLGESLWRAGGWVNVMTAEVLSKVKCLVDRKVREVLVSESYYLTLGGEEGEFILSSVGQRG
jgi:hypothetical protein